MKRIPYLLAGVIVVAAVAWAISLPRLCYGSIGPVSSSHPFADAIRCDGQIWLRSVIVFVGAGVAIILVSAALRRDRMNRIRGIT